MELLSLAKKVNQILKKKKLFIATAESCTGGLLAKTLTDIPGASACFDRGFITYSNLAKKEILGVSARNLEKFGAVSEQVACAMAKGALRKSHADISVAITGIAGPTGSTKNKPIGTVCFAFAHLKFLPKTATIHFRGGRNSIRMQAVGFVLTELLKL